MTTINFIPTASANVIVPRTIDNFNAGDKINLVKHDDHVFKHTYTVYYDGELKVLSENFTSTSFSRDLNLWILATEAEAYAKQDKLTPWNEIKVGEVFKTKSGLIEIKLNENESFDLNSNRKDIPFPDKSFKVLGTLNVKK